MRIARVTFDQVFVRLATREGSIRLVAVAALVGHLLILLNRDTSEVRTVVLVDIVAQLYH